MLYSCGDNGGGGSSGGGGGTTGIGRERFFGGSGGGGVSDGDCTENSGKFAYVCSGSCVEVFSAGGGPSGEEPSIEGGICGEGLSATDSGGGSTI